MAGIGHDDVLGLGPGAGQRVGGGYRTDQIIAALDDDGGDVAQHADIVEQRVFGQKAAILEVMRLDSRQPQSDAGVGKGGDRLGAGQQGRARPLEHAPRPGGGHVHLRVRVDQPPVISRQQIVALVLGQKLGKAAPGLGKHRGDTIEKPVDLLLPAQKDAAQHQPETALGVAFGIGQRQGAAPRAAEQQPALDPQPLAQRLHVADEVVRGVVGQLSQGFRAAGAALVEDDDAIVIRVEEPAVDRRRAGAGSAMQEHRRRPIGIAALLPIHLVRPAQLERAGLIRLDRIEESAPDHRSSRKVLRRGRRTVLCRHPRVAPGAGGAMLCQVRSWRKP